MNDDYTVALLEAIAEKLGIDVEPLKAAAARAQEDRLFAMLTEASRVRAATPRPPRPPVPFPYTGGPLYWQESPVFDQPAPVDPDRPVAR